MSKEEHDNDLSPCVGVCQYNDEDLCSGCFRSSKEISQWFSMTMEEKKKVINSLTTRMEELF
tara:strand:- start:1254 stop:1439 length:186 start_codon:yes stop_codon:yes gene_type:complete